MPVWASVILQQQVGWVMIEGSVVVVSQSASVMVIQGQALRAPYSPMDVLRELRGSTGNGAARTHLMMGTRALNTRSAPSLHSWCTSAAEASLLSSATRPSLSNSSCDSVRL